MSKAAHARMPNTSAAVEGAYGNGAPWPDVRREVNAMLAENAALRRHNRALFDAAERAVECIEREVPGMEADGPLRHLRSALLPGRPVETGSEESDG